MPDPTYLIRQINVNGHDHDLSALYIQDGASNKTWQDILDLVENIGFEILVWPDGTQFPPHNPATADDFAAYRNNIVLVKDATATSDECVEYVITRTQTGGTAEEPVYVYDWERIGTTTTDLSDYAKKGGYVTLGPSTNSTGAAGAATLTTTSNGAQTATGTATVTFASTTVTSGEGSAYTAGAATGAAGAHTISGSSFTFNGTKATLTHANTQGSVQIDKHKFTPSGTVTGSQVVNAHSHGVNITWDTLSYVTEAAAQEDGTHSHTVTVHEHAANVTAITELTTATLSQFNTGGSMSFTADWGFTASTSNVMATPTVDSNHVLSWSLVNATTQPSAVFTPATGATFTVVTGAKTTKAVAGTPTVATYTTNSTGAHTHSITFTTATVSIPTSITLNTAGGHTINGSNFSLAMNSVELAHNQVATNTVDYNVMVATVTVPNHEFTPAGTLSGEVNIADHTHSYNAPKNHTHEVVIPQATLTGTAAVAVTSHTHNVTLGNHTHDLGEHTHRVNIFTPVITVPYNSARD